MKWYANHIFKQNKKCHYQKTQWETIKTFANKEGVVVTKSNKGNSIVVLDDSVYYTKGYQFFNDQNFLKSLNNNEKEYKLLKHFLLDLKNSGSLDETFYKLVTPENFRTPIAYFLAKTHKSDFSTNLVVYVNHMEFN